MTLNPEDLKQMAADYAKAWCSHSPEAIASHYAADGRISINRGDAGEYERQIAEGL